MEHVSLVLLITHMITDLMHSVLLSFLINNINKVDMLWFEFVFALKFK